MPKIRCRAIQLVVLYAAESTLLVTVADYYIALII